MHTPVSVPMERFKLREGARAAGLDVSDAAIDSPELLGLLRMRRASLHTSVRVLIHAIDARIWEAGASSEVPYAETIPSINGLKRDVVKLELIQDAIDVLEGEHDQQQPASA